MKIQVQFLSRKRKHWRPLIVELIFQILIFISECGERDKDSVGASPCTDLSQDRAACLPSQGALQAPGLRS